MERNVTTRVDPDFERDISSRAAALGYFCSGSYVKAVIAAYFYQDQAMKSLLTGTMDMIPLQEKSRRKTQKRAYCIKLRDHASFKAAAKKQGVSMAQLVRDLLHRDFVENVFCGDRATAYARPTYLMSYMDTYGVKCENLSTAA